MNTQKYMKKDLRMSVIFIIIGAAAGITGFLFGYQKELMTGLTAGFLPTGIGMTILYLRINKKPELMKRVELENEERNRFINTKAGCTAFWVTYWYIFAAVILYNIIDIAFLTFLIATICFMPLVYFSLVAYYHRKY
jgi:hypothetical protein